MAVTRKREFPYTVTIDGQPVRLVLKRMEVPEFEQFRAAFISFGSGRGAPITVGQKTDTPVTVDQLEAEWDYLKANAEWQQDVFERYVTVAPGDVLDEGADGAPVTVTSGRQFANMFHGQGVIADILAQLLIENTLTEDQKKALPSRSASEIGSNTKPSPAAPGTTPETAAASVEPATSAADAAAMAPFSEPSSGTTDRSSFAAVR